MFAPEDPIRLDTFMDVVDQRPTFSIIALNAPVGYLNQAVAGGRTCDQEARALLGRRGASIKSAPVRTETRRKEIDLLPDHLDAISRTLLPRYREVAAEMAPFRQRTIYEVHSDLSFYQLNGDVPMQWSKNSEKGQGGAAERSWSRRFPGVERILDADVPGATASHLLDAAAFLWTARRIFAHAGIRIPTDPEWDEEGLRMEIVR